MSPFSEIRPHPTPREHQPRVQDNLSDDEATLVQKIDRDLLAAKSEVATLKEQLAQKKFWEIFDKQQLQAALKEASTRLLNLEQKSAERELINFETNPDATALATGLHEVMTKLNLESKVTADELAKRSGTDSTWLQEYRTLLRQQKALHPDKQPLYDQAIRLTHALQAEQKKAGNGLIHLEKGDFSLSKQEQEAQAIAQKNEQLALEKNEKQNKKIELTKKLLAQLADLNLGLINDNQLEHLNAVTRTEQILPVDLSEQLIQIVAGHDQKKSEEAMKALSTLSAIKKLEQR